MSQSKEELLLHAALKLFNENGFHGTATAKISKEAGVSTGTLYNYFESKEMLINKLYIYIKQDLGAYVLEHIGERTFKNLWASTIRWAIEHPDYFKFKESFYKSPYGDNMSKADMTEANKQLFEIAKDTVAFDDREPSDVAFMTEYFTGVLNATINYIQRNQVEDIEGAIERGYLYFCHGAAKDLK